MRWRACILLSVLSVAAAALADAPLPQAALLAKAGEHRFVTGSTPRRMIHFTFDDGPSVSTTRRLLDVLDALEIKATFFLSGTRLSDARPDADEAIEIARETARRGHLLASHAFRHTRLDRLSAGALSSELDKAQQSFRRVSNEDPALLRPPHGMHDARVDAALAARNMVLVNWNLNPTDYSVRDAQSVARNFFSVLQARERREGSRGGIVLMHDTLPWSRDALPLIVNRIDQINCELLAHGEELYEFVDDIGAFLGGQNAASAAITPDSLRQARARERATRRCIRRQ